MKKKIISIINLIIFIIIINTPTNSQAASNIKIDGVDIGYAAGEYFSKNGKACTCHNHGWCVPETSNCNCKHVEGTAQCYAFALYCENKLFGYNDAAKPSKFKNIGSVAAGKLTSSKIKELILKAPIGSHIRTNKSGSKSNHSMILVSKTNNGFTVAQANGSNNKGMSYSPCMIGLATYTWNGYVTSTYGSRGIAFIKAPKESQTKPSKPTITSFEAISTSSIRINWKSVSGATKYRIDRRKKGDEDYKTITSDCTSTSYTDKNLNPGTTYYYRVYAINSSGTSPRSETYSTYTKPNTPKEPTVTRDSQSQITISWNKVSGVTHYKLLCRKGGESDYKVIANNLTSTSYVHKGLKAGTQYCYRVVAVSKVEIGEDGNKKTVSIESGQSNTKSKFTTAKRPSNAIDNNNPTYTILEWDKATGDESSYTYEIWRNGQKIGTTKENKYTDKTCVSGTIYNYEIKINGISWTTDKFYAGPKMTSKTVVTPENATSMKISWSKPIGGNNLTYRIKKQVGNEYIDVGDTSNTYYIDKGLNTGEFYKYYIQVRDKDGNYITSNVNGSATLQILPSSVALNRSSVTLNEGDTLSLMAVISPSNSTDKAVSWSSSNTQSAIVSSDGTVMAKETGNAVITAMTANGKTASCVITVQSKICVHTYGDWITEKEATCTEEGSHYRICTKCGEGKETEVIPVTDHAYLEEWTVIKEPNCTEDGEQAHICTVCGTQIDNMLIEAFGHTYSEEWTTEKEATCTEVGIQSRVCTVCGNKEEISTEYLEHEYELTLQTEPTLTGPGKREYTCTICGNIYSEEYVPLIEEGTIEVGGTVANAGQTITIPVNINDNPGIAGLNFVLDYDKSVLIPKAITKGNMLGSGTFATNLEEGTPVSELEDVAVYWGDATNITDDGELFSITFEVNSNAPDGDYVISLNYEKGDVTDQSYNDVMPDIHANVIQIADVLKGDINMDGKINSLDSTLLAKVLAHYRIELTEKQREAANVFEDTKKDINIKDAVSLAQIIAGWENPILHFSDNIHLLSQDNNPTITVEAFEAAPGEYIDIPVTITDNPGISGFNFKLNYDKEKLTPILIEKSDMLINGNFASNLEETEDGLTLDYITATWNDTDIITENGVLFNIMFLVNDNVDIGDTLQIDINYGMDDICDQYLNSIDIEVEQGLINIIEYTEDDIDTDIIADDLVYYMDSVYMQLNDGTICDKMPVNGDFNLHIGLNNIKEEYVPSVLVTAVYSDNGHIISVIKADVTENIVSEGLCNIHIDESKEAIGSIKIFIWSSLEMMIPLSDVIDIT